MSNTIAASFFSLVNFLFSGTDAVFQEIMKAYQQKKKRISLGVFNLGV